MGSTRATGRPCLVITIPSGSRRSMMERHCSLNLAAGTVFMDTIYVQTELVSIDDYSAAAAGAESRRMRGSIAMAASVPSVATPPSPRKRFT